MSKKERTLKPTEGDLQASEVKTSVELVSFEDYIAKHQVNPGLVASFKYEALRAEKDLQKERSEDEWELEFAEQSNRVYE